MQSRLGAPVDDAIVHTDGAAARAADFHAAQAFTVGRHVFFGGGRYDPSSGAGAELLAHELAHVVRASPAARRAPLSESGARVVDRGAESGARHVAANGIDAEHRASEPLAVRRQPLTDEENRSRLPLQLPANAADVGDLVEVMRAIDTVKPSDRASDLFATVYQGRSITLSTAQVTQVRKVAKDALLAALDKSKRRAAGAVSRYEAQEDVNKEFPVTSRASKAWAWARSWGEYSNPSDSVYGEAASASLADVGARLALASGHYAEAIALVAKSDAASERTSKLVYAYIDQLLAGADSLVTGLEFTRNAAFVTLGVLAVVVTGGAALGLEAGVVGTGVGGLTVAQTATAISVGAPIVAELSEAGIQTALGDKVDWGKVGVNIAVQVILARFGGKLGAGIAGRIASPATQSLARQTIAALASGTALHVVSQGFTIAVDMIYRSLRQNKDATWADFVEALTISMS
ncbi:MAG TPA: DUF4157 domain-containing protein, partial [Nakamurella sp.]|nr:DUF4157 domain-containing protein [Nakamurella sp.]